MTHLWFLKMAYIRSPRRDKQDNIDFVFMIQYIWFYYYTICYMLHVQVTSVHVAEHMRCLFKKALAISTSNSTYIKPELPQKIAAYIWQAGYE